MLHDWVYSDGGEETVVECSHCGVTYGLHQERPSHGCKGFVDNDSNRPEPDEEVLRALGHGLVSS